VKVIEFGANVKEEDIFQPVSYSPEQTLQVLFLGVDWDRKGGDVAVDCVTHLNEIGIPAILHVVGTNSPKRHQDKSFINDFGFLRKNNPQEYDRFISIVRNSNLLLLPTRAECSAIAFCEASAYGIPVFTYDTGGIPNYVINGVNGYRLPLSASGADFATKIRSVIDNGELPVLSEGCRKIYHERLNWRHWRSEFEDILKKYGII
jgi:glycosyltransferase involved in cell wall biosynthesis